MHLEKPKALVIAVHYRTEDGVLALLASLQRLSEFPQLRVLIADNASEEKGLTRIRSAASAHANVELVECGANRGYFGAARFAFNRYLAQGHNLPDWVIVCNHDILIEDREFFTKLLCESSDAIGVIAPRIQKLPGKVDQNPFMRNRPSALRWAQLRFVSSNYALAVLWDWCWRRKSALKSWFSDKRADSDRNDKVKRDFIYAPHGSFIIVSRRFFEAGGYLDENLFLYGEEISVAEMCWSLSLPVIYQPALGVFHNEHQSTGKALSRFTYECQKNAIRYLTSRYLSPSERRRDAYLLD